MFIFQFRFTFPGPGSLLSLIQSGQIKVVKDTVVDMRKVNSRDGFKVIIRSSRMTKQSSGTFVKPSSTELDGILELSFDVRQTWLPCDVYR